MSVKTQGIPMLLFIGVTCLAFSAGYVTARIPYEDFIARGLHIGTLIKQDGVVVWRNCDPNTGELLNVTDEPIP